MAARLYRGIARREHAGEILGLTLPQALCCVALVFPVVWALAAGRLRTAGILAVACGVLVGLIVVPVRGRPALRWVGHWLAYRLGILTGWSRWQSRAATGEQVETDQPDLPGVLARLRFPEGPPFRDSGRVCLIHDTGDGRWAATARLTHSGIGLSSDDVRELLAARLGTLLVGLGQRGIVDRLSLYVRSVPDDGTDYALYRARHQVPNAPDLAVAVTDELDRTVGTVSVRHEVYLTLSAREDALRKPAGRAGGGVAGRAHVLYRAMDGIEEPLAGLGVQTIDWIGGTGLAEAIRTGFNPAASTALTAHNTTEDGNADGGLPWALAAAGQAPTPSPRCYRHDGFASVAYTVLMPTAGTRFGSLAPLIAPRFPGERRTLAVHYEIASDTAARRDVRATRFRHSIVGDLKRSRGFSRTATDQREGGQAVNQERAIDAGHGLVRTAWAASLTVPADQELEDHAARMEADAAGRFRLLRLELAQDSAFVAACLPVGIGLPRVRGALL